MIPGIVALAGYGGIPGSGEEPPAVIPPTYTGPVMEGQVVTLEAIGSGWYPPTMVTDNPGTYGYSLGWLLDGEFPFGDRNGPFNTVMGCTSFWCDAHHVGKVLSVGISGYDAEFNSIDGPTVDLGPVAALPVARIGWLAHNTHDPLTFSGTANQTVSAGGTDNNRRLMRATRGRASGAWYFEAQLSDSAIANFIGVGGRDSPGAGSDALTTDLGKAGTVNQLGYQNLTGGVYNGSNTATKTMATRTGANRIGVAVKVFPLEPLQSSNVARVWFTLDGVSWNGGGADPVAETGFVLCGHSGTIYPMAQFTPVSGDRESCTLYANASEFLFAPPTGYAAWDGGAT